MHLMLFYTALLYVYNIQITGHIEHKNISPFLFLFILPLNCYEYKFLMFYKYKTKSQNIFYNTVQIFCPQNCFNQYISNKNI
jgi:hypothetical protein